MNTILDLEKIAKENEKILDEAKLYTQYKIKYIKDYVRRWLNVAVNYRQRNIVFIDSMCNAGVYKNGIKGTCIEVIELFIEYAKENQAKQFYVFLNDYDKDKIRVLNGLISNYNVPNNLKINIKDKEVVEYLSLLIEKNTFSNSCFTLLYTDPYNFGIPNLLTTIKTFIDKFYCELLFNYFSSDVTRNKNNTFAKNKMSKIKNELSSVITDINIDDDENKEILNRLISTYKDTKNIKYSFAYRFNNTNNAELYYIIFFTPNKRGLELIKESIWEVFNGEESFKKEIDIDKSQLKLFNTDELLINTYSGPMKESIIKLAYEKGELSYEDIETYVLENSLLKDSHIIKPIIKPLLEDGRLEKIIPSGVRKNNYKESKYKISDKV